MVNKMVGQPAGVGWMMREEMREDRIIGFEESNRRQEDSLPETVTDHAGVLRRSRVFGGQWRVFGKKQGNECTPGMTQPG